MNKSDIFWQTYLNLEKEAIEVSKYIFFTDEILINGKNGATSQSCNSQLDAFSPHIADLLIRCCVQIESISKELYFDNGGNKKRGDSSILFDEDCLKLIDIKWETHCKTVMIVAPFFNFTKDENRFLKPLKEAHKRQGTYWEKAYQAVKHDRYYSLYRGNVKAFLHALAALYLLNLYYRNDSWITSFQDISKLDYSIGSEIFAVRPPATERLWHGNKPIFGESPYVAYYQSEDYKKIEEMQQSEDQVVKEYLINQPEWKEPAFQNEVSRIHKTQQPVPYAIYFWELGKYRLNKKIPSALSFEDRKSKLIQSKEWNSKIHQDSEHFLPDELTEENIQTEIDNAGKNYGSELMINILKFEWAPLAFNKKICRVCIP